MTKSKFRIFDRPTVDILPAGKKKSPTDRQHDLIAKIDEQIARVPDQQNSGGKKSGCWFGQMPDGNWWVGIFYNTKCLHRVKATDRKDVTVALKDFRAAVEGAAFDDAMTAIVMKLSEARRGSAEARRKKRAA